MGILGPLGRRAGEHGQIIGIDEDPSLKATDRDYLQTEGLANVELRASDPDAFQIMFTVTLVWGRKPSHNT
jgi:hypothetical protein